MQQQAGRPAGGCVCGGQLEEATKTKWVRKQADRQTGSNTRAVCSGRGALHGQQCVCVGRGRGRQRPQRRTHSLRQREFLQLQLRRPLAPPDRLHACMGVNLREYV